MRRYQDKSQRTDKKSVLRQINKHVKNISSRDIFEWRKLSGYYQQSKVENSFYSYKTIIGYHLNVVCIEEFL